MTLILIKILELIVFIFSNFELFKGLNFAEGKVIELYAKHTNCANQLE
jgi:hypothetical protein